MTLLLQARAFHFALLQPLRTSAGQLQHRRGWLLRLDNGEGCVGWGEVAPLHPQLLTECGERLAALPERPSRQQLEGLTVQHSGALGFGLGAALAELDAVEGGSGPDGCWLGPPAPALLLPAGQRMLAVLRTFQESGLDLNGCTLKWKVATEPDRLERSLLEQLLAALPVSARLRLDANGGWDRATASSWMRALQGDPRLDWLEQPLPVADQTGLEQLAERGPVALDESLQLRPELRNSWQGWQVRRPSVDGDPRPLLHELRAGTPRRMLSTAFETGIARRWLQHLAALQWQGPTPAAPGLAPGWCPSGPLFSDNPETVWAAAR